MKKVLIQLFVEVRTEIEEGSEMETAVDEMATAVNALVSPQLEKGCESGEKNNCSFEVKIQEMNVQKSLLQRMDKIPQDKQADLFEELVLAWKDEELIEQYSQRLSKLSPIDLRFHLIQVYHSCTKQNTYHFLERLHGQFGYVFFDNMKVVIGKNYVPGNYHALKEAPKYLMCSLRDVPAKKEGEKDE